ncbi:hypothetical protein Vadar_021471 [Vaccinium darrowii]|uniref:Uncharacterized protein n=1 Tax=Vaccinium darrowii TaxID=229202 RepID=A0ACB7YHA0_9ERIC|nr:hypothetical protein Vadar_021471 [Vaccinium darrowii]
MNRMQPYLQGKLCRAFGGDNDKDKDDQEGVGREEEEDEENATNIFRENPNACESIGQTKPVCPALALLTCSNDEEVLTDACWALSYLSDGTNDKIQAVIWAGVCSHIVWIGEVYNLRSHDNNEMYETAVKIVETYWLEDKDEQLPEGDAF